MSISAEVVRQLREETGAGMMDCKSALVEANGEMEKAREILRKKGLAAAAKKASRAATDGAVGAYIHQGAKVGVLVEVNCETDFVAKTADFQALVKDIAMHVAAASPAAALYVAKEDVPAEVLEKEKEIYRAQALALGQARGRGGQDRRGQAQGVLRHLSASSSSRSSRTPSSRSASSCRRRSRSSRRTSSCGGSRATASARSRRGEAGRRVVVRLARPASLGGPGRAAPGKDSMPATKKDLVYKRVLLKLSGEALLGEKTFGIDRDFADYLATEIARSTTWASRSRPSSAAATSSAASPTARRAWTASRPTTWACWRR